MRMNAPQPWSVTMRPGPDPTTIVSAVLREIVRDRPLTASVGTDSRSSRGFAAARPHRHAAMPRPVFERGHVAAERPVTRVVLDSIPRRRRLRLRRSPRPPASAAWPRFSLPPPASSIMTALAAARGGHVVSALRWRASAIVSVEGRAVHDSLRNQVFASPLPMGTRQPWSVTKRPVRRRGSWTPHSRRSGDRPQTASVGTGSRSSRGFAAARPHRHAAMPRPVFDRRHVSRRRGPSSSSCRTASRPGDGSGCAGRPRQPSSAPWPRFSRPPAAAGCNARCRSRQATRLGVALTRVRHRPCRRPHRPWLSSAPGHRLANAHGHTAAVLRHEAADPDANVPGVVPPEIVRSTAAHLVQDGLAVIARLRRRSTASSCRHAPTGLRPGACRGGAARHPRRAGQHPAQETAPAAPVAAHALVRSVASNLSAISHSRHPVSSIMTTLATGHVASASRWRASAIVSVVLIDVSSSRTPGDRKIIRKPPPSARTRGPRAAAPPLDRIVPPRLAGLRPGHVSAAPAPAAPVAAPAFVRTVASILSATSRSRQSPRPLTLAPDTSPRRRAGARPPSSPSKAAPSMTLSGTRSLPCQRPWANRGRGPSRSDRSGGEDLGRRPPGDRAIVRKPPPSARTRGPRAAAPPLDRIGDRAHGSSHARCRGGSGDVASPAQDLSRARLRLRDGATCPSASPTSRPGIRARAFAPRQSRACPRLRRPRRTGRRTSAGTTVARCRQQTARQCPHSCRTLSETDHRKRGPGPARRQRHAGRLAAPDDVGLQLRLSSGQSDAVRANALACGVARRDSVVAFGDIAFGHQDARLRARTDTSASTTAPTPAHRPMHVRGHCRRRMPAATRSPMTRPVPDIPGNGSPTARTRSCAAPATRRRLAALDDVGLRLRRSPGQPRCHSSSLALPEVTETAGPAASPERL